MSEPTVCAIMLTADRPELARRAVECFRSQSYDSSRRCLLMMDTGGEPFHPTYAKNEVLMRDSGRRENPIGTLRNVANSFQRFDIYIHWDDDDWSHPNRIAEQVALLQSSGADCVGYREMLFWREQVEIKGTFRRVSGEISDTYWKPGEAWLYRGENANYPPGTSLCYWRKTWERKPFAVTSFGEDLQFCTGLKVAGISSLAEDEPNSGLACDGKIIVPRMIARIHSGNTMTGYRDIAKEARKPNPVWRRVPEWDAHCRSVME